MAVSPEEFGKLQPKLIAVAQETPVDLDALLSPTSSIEANLRLETLNQIRLTVLHQPSAGEVTQVVKHADILKLFQDDSTRTVEGSATGEIRVVETLQEPSLSLDMEGVHFGDAIPLTRVWTFREGILRSVGITRHEKTLMPNTITRYEYSTVGRRNNKSTYLRSIANYLLDQKLEYLYDETVFKAPFANQRQANEDLANRQANRISRYLPGGYGEMNIWGRQINAIRERFPIGGVDPSGFLWKHDEKKLVELFAMQKSPYLYSIGTPEDGIIFVPQLIRRLVSRPAGPSLFEGVVLHIKDKKIVSMEVILGQRAGDIGRIIGVNEEELVISSSDEYTYHPNGVINQLVSKLDTMGDEAVITHFDKNGNVEAGV